MLFKTALKRSQCYKRGFPAYSTGGAYATSHGWQGFAFYFVRVDLKGTDAGGIQPIS
ncbi:hypothetical protein H6G17_02805 [Chroococcidiopsis sp. FACHB-1243]|uniref:hypothetical protein n=1 Tax=Chroococcidiopsis sp. [FACHB-1243] TaxID=2692781 RepID=UPI00178662E3|nr:hypothetical protein [Chroococcidiopsis sp. [FACHB-1243]]MBD2304452.1 hypothetical protein [Chroococcidiopsis sp. [FACHB-1243]]